MKTNLSAFAVYTNSSKKALKHAANGGLSKSSRSTTKKENKRQKERGKQEETMRRQCHTLSQPEQPLPPLSSDRSSLPYITNGSSQASTKMIKKKTNMKKKMRMTTSTPNGTSPRSTVKSQPEALSRSADKADEVLPSTSSNSYMFDSRFEGERCFDWLIHPFNKEKFFSEVWEKKPLLLKRQNSNYYRELFSTSHLDLILREKCLWFGKNLDVTTYTNGRRETHNPAGRAHASIVWDYYQNGCSVRLLNPQTFARSIWKLNVTLQEAFGCFVGANIYLTPPGSQGFAPHYDDIEAFVLQLEGKKRWKLYNPRREEEVLPRKSSENLREEDLDAPVLDVELKAGDLLYFPRGVIHQASTPPETHSLHITISTCQRNTWGDLFEKLVPRMLQLAIANDVEFRKALPRDYVSFMGVANSELAIEKRAEFETMTRRLLARMTDFLPLDSAADQMAKGFVHDALPPLFTKGEKLRTVFGSGQRWTSSHDVIGNIELDPDTRVKLLRANLIRLVMEEDGVNLYHSVDNSREYHAEEIQCIPMSAEVAPAVEYLIHAYPNFVHIESLPLKTLDSKMEVATTLYDSGLLITEEPIQPDILT